MSDKKLSDYIHYYIECRIQRTSRSGEYQNTVNLDPNEYYRINQETYPYSIKPILRRLEDMTVEEAIQLYREATKTHSDKDEYDVTFIKDKGKLCSIQVGDLGMAKMYMNINIEGDVLVYIHDNDSDPKIVERVANQHLITHYLLSKHFDLFGLIDSNCAVDYKTLK